MRSHPCRRFCLVTLLVVATSAWANPQLQNVSLAQEDEKETLIKLQFTEPLKATPASQMDTSPKRLVLIFSGVENATIGNHINIAQSKRLSSADIDADGEHLKISLNLDNDLQTPPRYALERHDSELWLRLQTATGLPTETATQPPQFTGSKLSLNFQSIDIRSALQVIADFTGLNIIASDTISGNLTLRLKEVPWDQALDIILRSKNLVAQKEGNVLMIGTREELAAREKLTLTAQQQIDDFEIPVTEIFQLNYQKAEIVQKLLSDKEQRFLSKRGTAIADARTNLLILTDTPSKLKSLRPLLRQLDMALKQVMIEARIVISDDQFSRELGARFGINSAYRAGNNRLGIGGNLNGGSGTSSNFFGSNSLAGGATPLTVALGGGGSQNTPLSVNLPIANPAGSLALSLLNLGSGNLINLELQAMESDNRGKIVSSPRVVTADNQKAEIEQGTEIPYVTVSQNGTSTQFKKATLKLAVTPQITPDQRVVMAIEINKDAIDKSVDVGTGATAPSISTKRVTTQIALLDGETAVIGGIYEEQQIDGETKVPLLGDIPILGHLFRSKTKQNNRTELLVFLTPHILEDKALAEKSPH